jgi:hypothetical protein
MEHPFLSVDKLSKDLSIDDLQGKISELTKKLNIAYSTGNGYLVHQVQMALESHTEALKKKFADMMEKSKNDKEKDYSDKIDIS